jgi:hypothetical protein
MYSVYSAAESARGEKVPLWPGHFGPSGKSEKECIANYPHLCEHIRDMMLVLRFFLAPLSCDTRIRQRIEAAIARSLYDTPGIVGTFPDQGVRYYPRRNHEEPIACVASSRVPLRGLLQQFWA